MNVIIIWSYFFNSIKTELNPLSFDTWFQNTELYEYKDGICKIIVPMAMYKKHLTTKYYDLIITNLSNVVGDNVDIKFYTQEEIDELNQTNSNENQNPVYIQNSNYNTFHNSVDNNFQSNINKN